MNDLQISFMIGMVFGGFIVILGYFCALIRDNRKNDRPED